ncbi:2-hydroxyacyl-CoA dehydratase subunit D [Planctomycetota bacterium]
MRTEYIHQQKAEYGRTAIAVLPIHYPKALLTAMDVLAVELWGPPGPPRGPAAGRLQSYVCAIARNALAFAAMGGLDGVDAVLYPHTCDALQGLATLLPDFGGTEKPALRYIHPKGGVRESSRKYVAAELRELADKLAKLTDTPLDLDRLRWAIGLHRNIDRLRATLLDSRARLASDDLTLYRTLRRGEYLWPEDHVQELEDLASELTPEPVRKDIPVMLTGIVPEPMSLLSRLNEAGAYVAADDYAAVGRRVVREQVSERADPFETLCDLAFAAPPCSTRAEAQQQRIEYLSSLYVRSGAAGLIIHTVSFCEPELFFIPAIRARFGSRGVPLLQLETELEQEPSAQAVTRIEAFVEMVDSARRQQ